MKSRSTGLRLICALVVSAIGSISALMAAPPAAAASVPVTVTITRFIEIQDPDPTQGDGDYYARVKIGATPAQDNESSQVEREDFEPYWTFTANVDDADPVVTVTIEIIDSDSFPAEPDDLIDINPTDGVTELSVNFNLSTGGWTSPDITDNTGVAQGDGDRELFGFTEGGEAGKVFFDISALSTSGDADGDALLDGWELHGIDRDGDGVTDVDLAAMGANPLRKDFFVETDCLVSDGNNDGDLADPQDHSHCPLQLAVQDVVQAFANAPVGNPDGTTGVQLHVDTGPLYGAGSVTSVPGASGVTGTFGDHGGGNQIPEAGNTIIDYDGASGNPGSNFYTLKQANFNANRDLIFRYSIFGHQTNARQATNDCTSGLAEGIPGNDFFVTLGGRRDVDGDGNTDTTCWGSSAPNGIDDDGDGAVDEDLQDGVDNDGDCTADTDGDGNTCDWGDVGVDEDGGFSIGTRAQQAGTFMHELGHVIGLHHGGGDEVNNKANYLSVMNYAFQPCSVAPGPAGSGLPGGCDYSRDDLNDLVESLPPGLDECQSIDAGLYGLGPVDFDNDSSFEGMSGCNPAATANVSADANGDGDANDTLESYDDWANIYFGFRTLENFQNGIADPVENEPTPEIIEAAQNFINGLLAPDLTITKTDSSDPVAAGEDLTYTLTVSNAGPTPTDSIQITDTLPAGVNYLDAGSDMRCDEASAGVIVCDLNDELAYGDSSTITIAVHVQADLVYNNGAPLTITNTAEVVNLNGADSNEMNNSISESTQVVAVADLEIVSFVENGATIDVLIGEPTTVNLDKVITSHGPSAPMDVALNVTTAASSGISVTPAATNPASADALGLEELRPVTETFTLTCLAPGDQSVTVTNAISPANSPVDSDPNPANNSMSVTLNVDCVVPVALNVHPGSLTNPINLKSKGNVPTAVLTTDVGEYGLPLAFDATTIDATTARFGPKEVLFNVATPGGAAESHNKGHVEDSYELDEKNRDGDKDMVLHFITQNSQLDGSDVEACVKGRFTTPVGDTFTFFGCDLITIKP